MSARVKRRRRAAPEEVRDGFKFRGGRPALDLAASLAARLTAPRELLEEPDDLARWLVAAGLTTERLAVTGAELVAARELREAIYRLARNVAEDKPGTAADRAVVNRWAALPPPVPQLAANGRLAWEGQQVRGLLAAMARDAVELLGGPDAARLRACSGDGCSIVFLDASRAGRRRWCSMMACGNKAKVAQFRQRES